MRQACRELSNRKTMQQRAGSGAMSDTSLLDKHPVGSREWCWLNGVADLKESAELAGVSKDSLIRNHADKILELGPRRKGMKRHVALTLGKPMK
jgi:hypothetical protein